MAEKKVWVSSKDSKPVHLIDRSVVVETDGLRDYQRISITKDMAEKRIPIEVINSMFVQGYYSDPLNLLELWHDVPAAQKINEDYFKQRNEDRKSNEVSKKEIDEANEKAIIAARKEFDRTIKLAQEKRGPKPKVSRNNDKDKDNQG